jgi:hypothetical protein
MEDENIVQIVTIPIETDIDPAELLDIIIGLREEIVERIEQHGIEAAILEEEISVEMGDEIHGG